MITTRTSVFNAVFCKMRDSSDNKVTLCHLDLAEFDLRQGEEFFSVFHHVQTGSETHTASCLVMSTEGKAAGVCSIPLTSM